MFTNILALERKWPISHKFYFSFQRKLKKTWLKTFLYIFTQLNKKSQDPPEVYSQNDSMPQRVYFSVLPLYKGKIYF